MMGKEFSEFQVEPVSGGTPESGQAIWQRVWKFQLERKCFYPTRHVQLGLGLIWGCFIYGHMVQVFACHKGSGLQDVRISTLILTSAYGSEAWCICWRQIIEYWILLENYALFFHLYFMSLHLSISPFRINTLNPWVAKSWTRLIDWTTTTQHTYTFDHCKGILEIKMILFHSQHFFFFLSFFLLPFSERIEPS